MIFVIDVGDDIYNLRLNRFGKYEGTIDPTFTHQFRWVSSL